MGKKKVKPCRNLSPLHLCDPIRANIGPFWMNTCEFSIPPSSAPPFVLLKVHPPLSGAVNVHITLLPLVVSSLCVQIRRFEPHPCSPSTFTPPPPHPPPPSVATFPLTLSPPFFYLLSIFLPFKDSVYLCCSLHRHGDQSGPSVGMFRPTKREKEEEKKRRRRTKRG